MDSLLQAAHRKWTHTDEAEIEQNWFHFEKALLRNQQRWSFGKLNLSTLQTFQDMYCHLQFRVRVAEKACGEAADAILELQEQLGERERELDMHEELGERLGQFRDFVAAGQAGEGGGGVGNGDGGDVRRGRARTRAGSGATTVMTQEQADEMAVLREQLDEAERKKEGLEAALQSTKFQLEELQMSIDESAQQANRDTEAGDDQLHDLQYRLQETEAQLARSLQHFEQLKLEGQSTELKWKQQMVNLETKLKTQKQESVVAVGQEAARHQLALADLESKISVRESEAAAEAQKIADRNKRIADLEAQLRAKERQGTAAKERAAELEDLLRAASEKYTRAQDNVRQLFDQVQDFRGNLRVMCRVRPRLGARDEELLDISTAVGAGSNHAQVLKMPKRTARTAADIDSFQMERVFDGADRNEEIFDEVGQLVMSAINGRNVCIFAYGQTGSGKTHTMNFPWNEKNAPEGDDVDFGIIPRSVEMISEFMRENEGIWRLSVSGKYIEVYAEKVYDLLREGGGRNGAPSAEVAVKYAKVKGADVHEAESTEVNLTAGEEGGGDGEFEDKVRDLLFRASANRRTRTTAGNAQSSRSHSVLTLRIVAERVDGRSEAVTEGLLNLIDLAGSEKPSTTDKTSQAEGIQINKSLSALRKVLGDMANPRVKHVSFRESILTKLLQSSLGDGCKTMMFVMVSPLKKDKEETRNTLEFAMTAQQAKLKTQASSTART